jgi:hypothetical protein
MRRHCEKFIDFTQSLDFLTQFHVETHYLIYDKAEKLREMGSSVLSSLLRLQDYLPSRNITVIFISHLHWNKFREGTGGIDPLVIEFPAYTKDILFTIECSP